MPLQFHNPGALSSVDDYVTNAPLAQAIGSAASNFFGGQNAVLDIARKRQEQEVTALAMRTAQMKQTEDYYLPDRNDPLKNPMQQAAFYAPDPDVEALRQYQAAQQQPVMDELGHAAARADMSSPVQAEQPPLPGGYDQQMPIPQLPFPAPLQGAPQASDPVGSAQQQVSGMGGSSGSSASLQAPVGVLGSGTRPTHESPGLQTRQRADEDRVVKIQAAQAKEDGRNKRHADSLYGRASGQKAMALVRLRAQGVQQITNAIMAMDQARLLGQPVKPIGEILVGMTAATNGMLKQGADQIEMFQGEVDQYAVRDSYRESQAQAGSDIVAEGEKRGDSWLISVGRGLIAGADKIGSALKNPDTGDKGPKKLTPQQEETRKKLKKASRDDAHYRSLLKKANLPY